MGIVGETSVDAPLSHFLLWYDLVPVIDSVNGLGSGEAPLEHTTLLALVGTILLRWGAILSFVMIGNIMKMNDSMVRWRFNSSKGIWGSPHIVN